MKTFYKIPSKSSELLEVLEMRLPAWKIVFGKEHLSTQLMAKEAFHDGLQDFALFIVKNQTSGRGRRDRGWISSPDGKDITMSLLIPLKSHQPNPAILNIIGGISVAEALSDLTRHDFKVKWPNDIYHGRAKVGGIISELLISHVSTSVAMGIGINVNSSRDFFHEIKSFYAIDSISSIIRKKLNLAHLIVEIIDRLQSNLILLDENMFGRLEKKWGVMGRETGMKIRYRELGGDWAEGVAKGITKNGYLAIDDENGNFIKALVEGDVVLIEY